MKKKLLRVAWKKPVLVPKVSTRGKKIPVHAAIVKNNTNRFLLYQNSQDPAFSFLWTLWDQELEVQHFLYGADLKHAKESANKIIRKIIKNR